MAADGSVYADGDYRQGNNMDLFRFPWTGDGYGSPVAVGVNTQYNEFAPCVAPDESYLIFVSNRPGGRGMHDLWITFKEGDGTWTEPLNMGPTINSSSEDGAPALTLDGLYLFFTTERSGDKGYNPYWVSTQVIQNLRSQAGF
jgi:Tol biopolymer transport system component